MNHLQDFVPQLPITYEFTSMVKNHLKFLVHHANTYIDRYINQYINHIPTKKYETYIQYRTHWKRHYNNTLNMGDHNAKPFTHGGPKKAYLNIDKPQSITPTNHNQYPGSPNKKHQNMHRKNYSQIPKCYTKKLTFYPSI